MEKKVSISKNYIYNLCYQILIIIIPIITAPYLSRVLGAEQIGIQSYTYSVVSCFILFGSLGITLYSQREVAYVQNNVYERSKIFYEMIILKSITLFISMIIYYFTCIKDNNYGVYYAILLIEIIANCLDVSWFLQGLEQFKKTVFRSAIVKIISTICIFIFVKSSNDLYNYILIHSLSVFFGNIVLWYYIPKYIVKIKVRDLKLKNHIKPIFLLCIPQFALQIYMVLDKTMLGILIESKEEVGFYEQAQKIVRLLLSLGTSLGTVMVPRIANMYAEKNKEKVIFYITRSFDFILFLTVPMMFGLIAVSDYFVPIFFGEGYDKVSMLLKVSSMLLVIIGLNNVTGSQFLLSTKKQNEFTVAVVVGAFSNILLNFILIPTFKSLGATIASILAESIVLIIELYYCKNYMNIKEILKSSIKKIISGLIMFLVVILIPYLFSSLITIIIKLIIGIIIYMLMAVSLRDEFCYLLINKLKSMYNKII